MNAPAKRGALDDTREALAQSAGILSGEQEAHLVQVYAALGCRIIDRRYRDEWVALELLRA